MSKEICPVCGKEIGFLTGKVKVKDGVVCSKCTAKAGFNTTDGKELMSASGLTAARFFSLVEANEDEKNLKPNCYSSLTFDDANKIMTYKTNYETFKEIKYKEILGAEIIETNGIEGQSGAKQALIGGVLAGNTGATIGGLHGRKATNVSNALYVEINTTNIDCGVIFIDFIATPTDINSAHYKFSSQRAHELTAKLQATISQNNSENDASSQLSVADELLKYKKLLDMNAITQEEYELVKKKLIG